MLRQEVLCAGAAGVLMIAVVLFMLAIMRRFHPGMPVVIVKRILPQHPMQMPADAECREQQESQSG